MEGDGTQQDRSSPRDPFTDFDTACHSAICAGCSCACDDISLYLKAGRLVRTLNLCEIAMKKFRSVTAQDRLKPLRPGVLDENLKKAAGLLRKNGVPLILGADALDESGIQASRELAANLKGLWLPWGFTGLNQFYSCVKKQGWASAILDEVRDRTDSVIFWRTDPLVTHHRHLSRYSYFPAGRYTERGNSDRNLTAVSDNKAIIEPLCQQFFEIEPAADSHLIKSLMHPAQEAPYDHRDFPLMVNSLQRASYIAVFVDPEKTTPEALDLLFAWSRTVNASDRKRMVILPLLNSGANIEGFTRISMEHYATACGYDFSGKIAGIETLGDEEVLSESIGSIVMIPSGPEGAHPRRLPRSLSEKPLMVITPFKQDLAQHADVTIPVALPGVETDGVFFRADGLPLTAKKIKGLDVDDYPSAEQVFKTIIAR